MSGCPFQQEMKANRKDGSAPIPRCAAGATRVHLFHLAFALIAARFHFIRAIQRLFVRLGCDTIRVPVLRADFFISADPRLCREVLVDRFGSYAKTRWEHRVLSPAMEDGLIVLGGEQWKSRRHATAPCFGPQFMARLTNLLSQVAAERISRWERTIDLDHESRCIINESMIRFFLDGSSLAEFREGADEFSRAFGRIERGLESRVFDLLFLKERLRTLAQPKKAFFRSLRNITAFIERRVANPDKSARENSVLHALLARIPSSNSVVHEIRSMLGAGATTGHLLSWIGYLLARHPDKQERLRREILAELGSDFEGGKQPGLARIEALPYLNAVIQEGLRLYPPAPYLIRERIAEGPKERTSIFLFSVWAIHRHPGYWDGPDEFRPERWCDGETHSESAFIPFGLGPRVCIGKRFAMTEVRVILVEMLRRYRLELPLRARDPVPVFTVLTRPAAGVEINPLPIA